MSSSIHYILTSRHIFATQLNALLLIAQILLYITAGCLFIQTLYSLINWIGIARYKPATKTKTNPVSVIVCAHNELENIKTLIPQIMEQDHPDFELVIVDDRSDDGTYDWLLTIDHPKIKVVTVNQVHDHINAKKYAITLGIKAATYDILLFTDADCMPDDKQWIQSMTNHFDPNVNFSIGVSQYEASKGFLNKWIRFETQMTASNYIGFAQAGNPYMSVGRNLAYRKSFFLDNNAFRKFQHVMGGDDDLLVNHHADKKTTTVSIGKIAMTHSQPKTTWSAYFTQKKRHISVSKYYRLKDKLLLGIQNLSHSLFWIGLVTLATQTDQYILPAGLFLFRLLFMVFFYHSTSKKFGDRINTWFVPILDILYVFYVNILGTIAIFTKKVKWK